MILYQLSGWEGSSYCTHTAFFATSLDEAEQLCNELFDKFHPTYCQHILKADIARENKNELYDIEKKAIEPITREIERMHSNWDRVRGMPTLKLRHKGFVDSMSMSYKINLVKQRDALKKEYSDKRNAIDSAFYAEFQSFDEYFCNALGFDETLDKEHQVKYWMKCLHEINANALEFMCEQNGD